ncbi:MAG: translation initiation factor IF-2 subunit beta [Candidatus Aenigmatarchaeota archaeon]
MEYDELLKRAKEKSSGKAESSRFEVPEPELMHEGNKTIIKNFSKIADAIRRPEDHIVKFFSRELAVPGEAEDRRAVFNGRFSEKQVNEKLEKYMEEFVFCPACDKVDTKLIQEQRIYKIKCEACGTKQAVRQL